jgi:DNA end-binding protein Ku
MPRAIWNGTISFGLVEIPVSLVPAEERDDIGFSLLDRRDLAPVGYRRVNKTTGEEVPWEDIVKGYEYEKGNFVAVTQEDLEHANVEGTKTVDVVEFVDPEEIDAMYYGTAYYLKPARKGSKSYALLRETLRRTGKIGIAKVVIRTRQHLAALAVRGTALVLVTLKYAHQLRSPSDLGIPDDQPEVTRKELEMAERLVEGMTAAWKPDQFKDRYREEVLALIQSKVAAAEQGITAEPAARKAPRKPARIHDLMSLLKESIAKKDSGKAEPAPARRPAKKAAPKSRRARKSPQTA